MIYCPNCGKKINDSVEFCPYCGAKQNFSHEPKIKKNHVKHNKIIILILLIINFILGVFGSILYQYITMNYFNVHPIAPFLAEDIIQFPPFLVIFIINYFVLIKILYTRIKFRKTFIAVTMLIIIFSVETIK